jgi:hypothetical protein
MPPPIPVVLAPYDSAWPEMAIRYGQRLQTLGYILVKVHHIGSTQPIARGQKVRLCHAPEYVPTRSSAACQGRERHASGAAQKAVARAIAAIPDMLAEIERLHERLEDNRYYDKMVTGLMASPVQFLMGSIAAMRR